jgi:hypothetical protein
VCVCDPFKAFLPNYNNVVVLSYILFTKLYILKKVDNKVFVVHGGLFGRSGVTIKDIEEIDRLDYNPAPPPEPEATTPEEERAQDLRQLMRDCLCKLGIVIARYCMFQCVLFR